MGERKLHNPSSGEILKKEFLDELNISQNSLAKAIGVPPNRIHDIVRNRRNITADTDIRLCKFFGLSEGYFLRLQDDYMLMEAKRSLGKKLYHIKTYKQIRNEAFAHA
jgi:addiction module HigA family antidote